tara:strand:+ start:120 stop:878 length:759 start_codon:yes stop_codon:yes gene_type:complete
MAYTYTYTTSSDPGSKTWDNTATDLVTKNHIYHFDKKSGMVTYEFDYKGPAWDPGETDYYPRAWIACTDDTGPVIQLYPTSSFKRVKLEMKMYEALGLQKYSGATEQNVSLIIRKAGNSTEAGSETVSREIDLDPNEYHLTILSPSSANDSTPDIEFELTDLFKETFMLPTLKIGGNSVYTVVVTLDDDTTVSMGLGIINLNGVKFSESSLTMDSTSAGKAYFQRIKKYKMTSPSLSEGEYTYTINLTCSDI